VRALRGNFFDLAAAGEQCWVGTRAAAADAADYFRAGGNSERSNLLRMLGAIAPAEIKGDEQRATAAGQPLKHAPTGSLRTPDSKAREPAPRRLRVAAASS